MGVLLKWDNWKWRTKIKSILLSVIRSFNHMNHMEEVLLVGELIRGQSHVMSKKNDSQEALGQSHVGRRPRSAVPMNHICRLRL
jgi:hypothetical protein